MHIDNVLKKEIQMMVYCRRLLYL